jgi:hypothetical protein
MKESLKPYLQAQNQEDLSPQIIKLNQSFAQDATIDQIRKNLVAFNIYYTDLRYNQINGVKQIDWFILVANIAGICGGSFLGISLISVVEFLELWVVAIGIIVIAFLRKMNVVRYWNEWRENKEEKTSKKIERIQQLQQQRQQRVSSIL